MTSLWEDEIALQLHLGLRHNGTRRVIHDIPAQPQSRFLQLPGELRNLIFTSICEDTMIHLLPQFYVMQNLKEYDEKMIAKLKGANQAALTVKLTCLQIYRETRQVIVRLSNIVLNPWSLSNSYRLMHYRSKITRMTVEIHTYRNSISLETFIRAWAPEILGGGDVEALPPEGIVEAILLQYPALRHLTLKSTGKNGLAGVEFLKPKQVVVGKTLVEVERGSAVEDILDSCS